VAALWRVTVAFDLKKSAGSKRSNCITFLRLHDAHVLQSPEALEVATLARCAADIVSLIRLYAVWELKGKSEVSSGFRRSQAN
jgi:hypothetical protein